MNRIIKFRYWDKQFMKMYIPDFINFWDGKLVGVEYIDEWGDRVGSTRDDYVLLQFTGLKDKNGKEIYEGDILDFTVFDHNGADYQYKGIIKFEEGQWQLWKSLESEYYAADGAFNLYWVIQQDDEIEVIGNIYENPELLKI